MHIATDVTEVG